MEHAPGITVAEALHYLPRVRVVAGRQGLERVITAVNVMEVPDIVNWVRPGELLFTVLYAIRDDSEAQKNLVPELHRRGLAGLAIKPRRYVDRIPESMVEAAERLQFPLLEFPHDASHTDLIMPVMTRILAKQNLVLSRSQQAHRALMKVVLEGGGLERVAATLAELLQNPVLIHDAAGRTLAAAGLDKNAPDPAALAAARPGSSDFLVSAGETIHRRERIELAGKATTRVISPIVAGGRNYGHILVWEGRRRLGEIDLITLDSATMVIALELINQRALLEVERRYRGEFLQVLLAREAQSEASVFERARMAGWDLAQPYFALAVEVDEQPPPTAAGRRVLGDDRQRARQKDRLFDLVDGIVPGSIAGKAGELLVVLVPALAAARGHDPRREAQAVAETLKTKVERQMPDLRLSIGIGSCLPGLGGIRKSVQEAKQALPIGRRVRGTGHITAYGDLGVFRLVSAIPPGEELDHLLSRVLPLIRYDAKHRTDLMKTLELYFECHGNVKRVSERLYTHYNTVLYRLERIRQITGVDFEDSEARLSLHLALQAAKLFPPDDAASGPVESPRKKEAGRGN